MSGPGPEFSAAAWSRFLSEELDRRVRVRFGKARRNVLVARDEGHVLDVRMNALFAEAPGEVRAATAAWLRSGKRARRASELLDDWVASLEERLKHAPRARPRLRNRGEVHDLRELLGELFATDFHRVVFPLGERPAVTWGRRGKARRQLQLGSFDPETNLVRIHPVLDQQAVPRFFVRYVLFHEVLHAALPTPRRGGGRAVHHGPAFRRREEAYPDYRRALQWQADNLRGLLRSSYTGEPMKARRSPKKTLRALQRWLFPDLAPDTVRELPEDEPVGGARRPRGSGRRR